jgi:hypothetical protein
MENSDHSSDQYGGSLVSRFLVVCEDHICSWNVNALLSSFPWGSAANGLLGQKMPCKFLIASTYDYIRNTCLWLLSTRMLYLYLSAIAHVLIITWIILSMQHPFIHPYAYSIKSYCLLLIPLLSFTLLLLLLFYYCHYYKTIATYKLLRASLFPGTAKLTTHLLRLINIRWLPLNLVFTSLEDCCDPLYLWSSRLFSGAVAGEHIFICKFTWNSYCSLQSIHHG